MFIVHLDLDSYFASVEQYKDSSARNKPLVVVSHISKYSTVLASSIEAKRLYKIKTGMSQEEALLRCPNLIIKTTEHGSYRQISEEIMNICKEYSSISVQYSIDEIFLMYKQLSEDLVIQYAHEIQNSIAEKYNNIIRVSVGIAPNFFLAKLASDLKKPNGFCILSKNNDEYFTKIPVEKAWGIGEQMKRKFHRLGIHTLLDLKRFPLSNLISSLGSQGYFWKERLLGNDPDLQMMFQDDEKSIGSQRTLLVPVESKEEFFHHALDIALILAKRMNNQIYKKIQIFIIDKDNQTRLFEKQAGTQAYFGADPIYEALQKAYNEALDNKVVRFISVTLKDFSENKNNISLMNKENNNNYQNIFSGLDKLKAKYGKNLVWRAQSNEKHIDRPIGFTNY